MILHLYFARRFLRSFLLIFGVFFLLTLFIDLVEELRKFSDDGVGFGRIFGLTLLATPAALYEILPLIMILSTVTLFLSLARSSELVVVRAAGRSALRTLVSPLIVAFLLGVFIVAVMNPLVAATSRAYSDISERYKTGGSDVMSVSADGLWLRQGGTAEGQTVIRASRANAQATELYDVSFLTFTETDGGQVPSRRIEAASARLSDGAWQLRGVKIWPLDAGTNPEAGAMVLPQYSLPSTLTEQRIRDSFASPSSISIWQLPAYIQELRAAGFAARRHLVWFQMELARPLFLVALVLVSSAFTMRPARFGRTGVAVLATIMLGFSLYYIRNFAQVLGESGQIPVMLAAWAPPIASLLLATGLLLQMEDG
ncbi:LPS export ABC transporter permease LptG [Pseudooceanicola sp. CBS1P-1]|uniref:LPS export ABC transporter permease LptG n=1 Tax=Pseudooceanicola albus TaxID=2692189 RepID=A0A6L7G1J2_9RHOB|nr:MULTISPECIES: LPS export ABC transporter permease LptG [Pseudooceanicola]MBT9383224.1 LPS export ABC transporter permease LptG [Pseudooceanicola endophyticus]MXN16453.1 LPS export ABC transporter permease LptG [Pseudooceanicola albus]